MSDTETLAAILAEMRESAKDSYAEKTAKRLEDHESTGTRDALDIKDAIQCLRDDDKYLLDLADRIEAAEREMAKEMSKKLDENRAITGNAAAMREELNKLDIDAHRMRWDRKFRDEREGENFVERVIDTIRRVLAAPARNADRFATEMEAWEFYLAHTPDNGNIIDGFPTWLYATEPVYGDAAPAEGGAE
jgi:hypothetical protein